VLKLAATSLLGLALLTASAVASAEEPWADADPKDPPKRIPIGDFGATVGAEYRAQLTYINPISLNTVTQRRASWIEHRLRLDGSVDYTDKVRIVTSIDVLDGVLWGDNGVVGKAPEPNAGTTVNTRNPNDAVPCLQYLGGDKGDPLDANYYGYGLCDAKVFKVRRLYGEAVTPIGVVRIGRQPFTFGNNMQGTPGDGRFNRFGIAREGNYVDRVLFATKPLEILKPKEKRDTTEKNGLILAAVYDHLVTDEIRLFSDDAHQAGGAVIYRAQKYPGGKDLDLSAYYVHRWNDLYKSHVNIFGGRALSRFGPVYVGIEGAANVGSTREIAAAYKTITNDPVVDQKILQVGARAVARLDQKYWSAYLELDYASGDPDPQARTPLTQFVWAPDMNVGLLLFEHVLRFQSARAAAAATETLKRLGAPSYPVDSIDTRGSFTDAAALFPQIDFRPVDTVLFRAGVLVAWAPAAVIDPVKSLLGRDGVKISDDLVNFAGGKPGHFYGTEVDLRGQWRFLEHMALDLEGAVLFPGDALQDANGQAVRSVLLQGRTSFFF
jgi:hypothetical protein